MEINTEEEVYSLVKDRLELSEDCAIDETRRNGKALHLVGEAHGFLDQVKYVHENIVPLIKRKPDLWMLLREGYFTHSEISDEALLAHCPDIFYFNRLPRVLGIPVDDAVKSPLDPDIKHHIVANGGLTEEEIDTWFYIACSEVNPSITLNDIAWHVMQKLEKPVQYVLKLHDNAARVIFEGDRSVHEKLMVSWNQHARKKLDEILEQHPTRTSVLVSVGLAHLPAFSDNHTYIG